MQKTCIKCGFVNNDADPDPMDACPKCGVIYQRLEATSIRDRARAAVAEKRQKETNNKTAKEMIVLAFAVALLLILNKQYAGTDTTVSATTEDALPMQVSGSEVNASATEIFAAYDANEVAGDQRFRNRRIHISGIVSGITTDLSSEPIVQLTGGDGALQEVWLYGLPAEQAARLAKGDAVSASCIGAGTTIGTPILKSCQ